jgi:hypothetical protein
LYPGKFFKPYHISLSILSILKPQLLETNKIPDPILFFYYSGKTGDGKIVCICVGIVERGKVRVTSSKGGSLCGIGTRDV